MGLRLSWCKGQGRKLYPEEGSRARGAIYWRGTCPDCGQPVKLDVERKRARGANAQVTGFFVQPHTVH